jgi:hypothetical protein
MTTTLRLAVKSSFSLTERVAAVPIAAAVSPTNPFSSTIKKLEDLPSDGGHAVDVLAGANLRIFVGFRKSRLPTASSVLGQPRSKNARGQHRRRVPLARCTMGNRILAAARPLVDLRCASGQRRTPPIPARLPTIGFGQVYLLVAV